MKPILACICLGLGTMTLRAQYEPPALDKWNGKSPDGLYLAKTRIISNENGRTDLDTGSLTVFKSNGSQGQDSKITYYIPRLIAQIHWSPDSKYIVMTTVSAGGHSPWHFSSYVYCIEDKTLRYMDETIGAVVSEDFEFTGPHTVTMKLSSPDGGFENPKSVSVDLVEQALRMQKQERNFK